MKSSLLVGVIAAFIAGVFLLEQNGASPAATAAIAHGSDVKWRVYFSPDGGCTDAIVSTLRQAKKTVRVQAYSFTSTPIAKALVDAAKRGVDVCVILDKSQRGERYSSADFLANARVPVLIDEAHAIAHDKVMVIDSETVITGSFNFTRAAESRNSENLLILHSVELARHYLENWERHRQHAEPYQGKAARATSPAERETASTN